MIERRLGASQLIAICLVVGWLGSSACSPPAETPAEPSASPGTAAEPSTASPEGIGPADPTRSTDSDDASASCPPARRAGAGSHWAGLVVTFSDGSTETVCVGFDEPTIDGYALLRRSPLSVIAETYSSPMGVGICKLSGTAATDGCDYPDQPCFCAADPVRFWTIWRWQDGDWVFSTTGAAQTRVADGETLGYRWGAGEAGGAPSRCDFVQICGGTDPG